MEFRLHHGYVLPNSANIGDSFIQDDGARNAGEVGHRLSVLADGNWGIGYATRADGWGSLTASGQNNATSVLTYGPTAEFVSWPAAGYVPYNVLYARWSVRANAAITYAKFGLADTRQATITVTANGVPVKVTVDPITDQGGLVWTINGDDGNTKTKTLNAIPDQTSDTVYDVTISNVLFNGVPRTWKYQVIGFNPTVPSKPNKAYDDLFDWAAYAYPSLTSDTNTNGSYIAGDWYYRCYGITATQPTCFGVNQATGKLNVLVQGNLFDVGTAQYWLDNSDVLVQQVTFDYTAYFPGSGDYTVTANKQNVTCGVRSMTRVRPDIPVVTTPYVGDGDRYAVCSFVAKRSATVKVQPSGSWSGFISKTYTLPATGNKVMIDETGFTGCYTNALDGSSVCGRANPLTAIIGPWLLK